MTLALDTGSRHQVIFAGWACGEHCILFTKKTHLLKVSVSTLCVIITSHKLGQLVSACSGFKIHVPSVISVSREFFPSLETEKFCKKHIHLCD